MHNSNTFTLVNLQAQESLPVWISTKIYLIIASLKDINRLCHCFNIFQSFFFFLEIYSVIIGGNFSCKQGDCIQLRQVSGARGRGGCVRLMAPKFCALIIINLWTKANIFSRLVDLRKPIRLQNPYSFQWAKTQYTVGKQEMVR